MTKTTFLAAATALAAAPALATGASAAPASHGSWTFTDQTPDPGSLVADVAMHTVTGATITSWCHGSRVPAGPQDVTAKPMTVAKTSVLTLQIATTGVWGVDVNNGRGATVARVVSTPNSANLSVRLPAGRYTVVVCNLGGVPTASVAYQLTRTR